MMITVSMFSLLYSSYVLRHVCIMFLWVVFIDKLYDKSAHVFTTVFIMFFMVCIHSSIHPGVFGHDFINESKLSLSLSLFLSLSIPISVFSSHGDYMI